MLRVVSIGVCCWVQVPRGCRDSVLDAQWRCPHWRVCDDAGRGPPHSSIRRTLFHRGSPNNWLLVGRVCMCVHVRVRVVVQAIQKTVDANNAASNWDKRFVPLAKNLDDTLFGLLYIGVPKAAAAAAASTGSSGGAGGGAGAGKAKKSDSKEQDDDAAALDDIACFAEWSVDDGLDEVSP